MLEPDDLLQPTRLELLGRATVKTLPIRETPLSKPVTATSSASRSSTDAPAELFVCHDAVVIGRPALVVLFVAAHPDDDVMGAAGLIALHRDDPDLRFVLVHATDGEAGEIAVGSGATPGTLGEIRRQEDRRGWGVVGRVPDRHEWLGLPDGGLQEHVEALTQRLTIIVAQERPDLVWTCGPDGTTGHPDHIAVSTATTAAFHAVRATAGPGLRRLLHSAVPQSVFERLNARRVAAGLPAWDPTRVYHLRGVPDVLFDYSVDQSAVVGVIRDAFREHRSQWAPPWSESSDAEWFSSAGMQHLMQAWPARERGLPRLPDPFDGLRGLSASGPRRSRAGSRRRDPGTPGSPGSG